MHSQRYEFVEETCTDKDGNKFCKSFVSMRCISHGILVLVVVTLAAVAVWQHCKLGELIEQNGDLNSRLHDMGEQMAELCQKLNRFHLSLNASIQQERLVEIFHAEPRNDSAASADPLSDDLLESGTTDSHTQTENLIPTTSREPTLGGGRVGYDASLAPIETKLSQLGRVVTILTKVVTAPTSQPISAEIEQPKILIRANTSRTLMCESYGMPLSSCYWGRTKNGQRELIIIDQQVLDSGGATTAEGISYVGTGLDVGQCGLKIESVTDDEAGAWSCTLISKSGTLLTGKIGLMNVEGALASRSIPASVREPKILIRLNISQTIVCDSDGQPLSACFWIRTVNAERQPIIIDQEIVDNGGATPTNGISYFGHGLDAGHCGLKVESISEDNVGPWSCTLLTKSGIILNGTVNLMNVSEVLGSQPKSPAAVVRPIIYAKGNGSQTVFCESHGQPLSACIWEIIMHGTPETIVLYENASLASNDGVLYLGDGLHAGECGLQIESVFDEDVGLWTCTLLAKSGSVLTGHVTVETEVEESSAYFITYAGNIKAISLESLQVRKVIESRDDFYGITYDSIRHKVYWSGRSHVFRAFRDGSGRETVFDTSQYGTVNGLDFDWIAGNIYLVTERGHVLACDAKLTHGSSLRCAVLIRGLSSLHGIAVNPAEGKLYFSRHSPGSIMSAGTDGSDRIILVSRLQTPYGIAIDFSERRIYWADRGTNRIQSCDTQGQGIRTVVQLRPGDYQPWGIALLNGTVYWGNYNVKAFQSGRKSGQDVRSVYNGDYIRMLTIVPPSGLPTNRTNHCKGQRCSGICVLTTNSFRCLN